MKKKNTIETFLYSSIGVAAMFVIMMAVYLICGVARARVDLTHDRLYTLSKGTRKILAKIDPQTPVEIRYYVTQHSKEMPVLLKTYAQRVEDLLGEYKKAAGGRIELKKLDPEPDSDAEDSANFDGIQGQLAPSGEKIYLGLAVSQADAKAAIPYLSPDRERLLEYDISRAISSVITTKKPVIGIMSPLPVFGQMNPMMMRMGQAQEPWIFVSELKRDFDVRQVDMNAADIPPEIDVLLVVHPKEISDQAQFAIDQFVLRGGKLIAFVDPFMIVDQSNQQNPMMPNMPAPSSLDKLFKAWGIQFENSKVVADMNFAKEISLQRGVPPQLQPCFLFVDTRGINADYELTSQIDSLWIPFGGVFKGTPAEGLKETVLVKTTTQSQMVDGFMAQLSGANIVKDFQASGTSYPVVIQLEGKFKTAFPEGKPKASSEEKKDNKKPETPPALKASKKENVVLLVADADLLFNDFLVRVQEIFGQRILIPQHNSNLAFIQNMVEQMAGDSNLIGIRSRATMTRPFTVVQDMQAKAEAGYRSRIKDLEKSLSDTQTRLNELQRQRGAEGSSQRFILSPEQQAEIKKFQQDEVKAKRDLKELRKNLRRDIDSLETRLKWINIAAMPFLVTLSGITLALIKRKRTAAK